MEHSEVRQKSDDSSRYASARRAFGCAVLATLLLGFLTAVPARAEFRAATEDASCGVGVSAEAADSRHINLVIDDSGSMFEDVNHGLLDRWSKAKYALEVFAAMLGGEDTLNVYRMSDFADGRESGPNVSLSGTEPTSARVAKIHAMQMQGGDTPYAPVQRAYGDLVAAASDNKWLVILTDGEFDDRPVGEVQQDVRAFVAQNTTETNRLRVAFLAIGQQAPVIANEPASGIHFELAPNSADLLDKMTEFSNLIFERDVIASTTGNSLSADIDLSEVLVFAQGQQVAVGDASGSTTGPPESSVEVTWVENVRPSELETDPVPDRTLRGVLARYADVPRGDIAFDITGAETVSFFYKPKVRFGIELRETSTDTVVDAGKIVGGEYTLDYGFMNAECAFITSSLLGDVEYSARAVNGDEVIAESFQPGDLISFDRGTVQLDVTARYLAGHTSRARINLTVLQPARATGFDFDAPTYNVSELDLEEPPQGAIAVTYGLSSSGDLAPFSAEEWASVHPDAFTVASSSNLEFEIIVGEEPGRLFVVPHAAGGDVYAADTGKIPLSLTASHVFDEQLYEASSSTTVIVVDDIGWLARFGHWFADVGWKFFLALVLLVLILGYVLKPRFSKKIKRSPTVAGVPMSVGVQSENGNGKFRVQSGRKLLPFVADRATATYVPQGVSGFRALRLKAGRGGKMTLLNWKQIAERKNVALNGNDLNEDTKRAPILSPSTSITAAIPNQMRYELYLNN
ncbi:hypothetical protein [Microbacterium terregens]|uniref:VWFA domain-containing protein n=1 Tax=Microbacterium terregens TaxID=69363 RepID=A0ABV5T0W5_9MICO